MEEEKKEEPMMEEQMAEMMESMEPAEAPMMEEKAPEAEKMEGVILSIGRIYLFILIKRYFVSYLTLLFDVSSTFHLRFIYVFCKISYYNTSVLGLPRLKLKAFIIDCSFSDPSCML